MKKLFILSLAILNMVAIQAQSSLGFQINAVNAKIVTGDALSGVDAFQGRTALGGGLVFAHDFNSTFGFETGALYTPKGFMFKQNLDQKVLGINIPLGYKVNTNLNYVQVPVLAKLKFGQGKVKAFVKAGPTIEYLAEARLRAAAKLLVDINVLNQKIPVNTIGANRLNLGGKIGAGFEVQNNNGAFFAEAGYDLSFNKLNPLEVVEVPFSNRAFTLGLGYRINL